MSGLVSRTAASHAIATAASGCSRTPMARQQNGSARSTSITPNGSGSDPFGLDSCASMIPQADRPRFIQYPIAHGVSDDAVGCITEDQLGRLYLGRASGHIDRLDPATGDVRHYTAADGLAGAIFTMAFRDRSGRLWFGAYDGLFRLVPAPDRPRSPPRC